METQMETYERQHEPMWKWVTSLKFVEVEPGTSCVKPKEGVASEENIEQVIDFNELTLNAVEQCRNFF
jgi:hypothetical protein